MTIDWPGIQTNSVSMGIRGAARAASAHLSAEEQERFVNRVMQRAYREGWETKRLAIVQAHLQRETGQVGAPPKPLSANVSNGAEAAAIQITENGRATRSAGMEYAKLVTEHARDQARTAPETALEAAPLVKSALQSAAIAGDWQGGVQGSAVMVNVNLLGMPVEHLAPAEQVLLVDPPDLASDLA